MFLVVAQLVQASCPPYDFTTPQEAKVVFDGLLADAALATTARDNLFAALPVGCRNTVATSFWPNVECPADHFYDSSPACTIAADGLDASGTVSMSEEHDSYDQEYCSIYDTTTSYVWTNLVITDGTNVYDPVTVSYSGDSEDFSAFNNVAWTSHLNASATLNFLDGSSWYLTQQYDAGYDELGYYGFSGRILDNISFPNCGVSLSQDLDVYEMSTSTRSLTTPDHQIEVVDEYIDLGSYCGSTWQATYDIVSWATVDGVGQPVLRSDWSALDADGDLAIVGVDDCDDNDPTVSTCAIEICDGKDNDCNGAVDEGLPTAPYPDADQDGYGDSAGLPDCSGVGVGGDCDDSRADVSPGGTEVWYDGIDQDCDGRDDDQDEDGFALADDCDDLNANISPNQTELWYDGTDQNCDGRDDDQDEDGFALADDCDDLNPNISPDSPELWYDGTDQNCDGRDDDQDEDGFALADDCDDLNSNISPGSPEIWYDGTDQNCDGNDGDQDGDGYAAKVVGEDDCDDTDAAIHPDAAEVQDDGIDQDCDGEDAQQEEAKPPSSGAICGVTNAPPLPMLVGAAFVLVLRRRRDPKRRPA